MRLNIIDNFITLWNKKDIQALGPYMTDHVELRSTNVLRIFPDSNGVIKGRQSVLEYFEVVLKKVPNFVVDFQPNKETSDSIIVNSKTIDGLFDFHVQYHFDHQDKIYLIKSDLSEKF